MSVTPPGVTVTQVSSEAGLAAIATESVKEHDVHELASPQNLAGNGFTTRFDWGDKNGQWILNLNWGAVTRNSRIFVAIGEGAPGGGKFIGAARYTVHNVAPQDGRVSIWINIEWSSPIRLYVDYLVVNP
jgi:hypothetical protein